MLFASGCRLLLFLALTGFVVPVFAEEKAAGEETFAQCVARLQARAESEGIAPELAAALDDVEPLERTIELDRSQPEFVQTFADYFNARVNRYRIQRGRRLLKQNREFLSALTREYGVPPQYLVAFWAMESNFGRNIGKMSILDTLTTLACDQRRSEFFTGELMNALRVMGQYEVPAEDMEGSWAGAIGHTQFLPTAYLKYGVDGDGDGRVDLWDSQADALTSAAFYLQELGWETMLRWGREVRLPEDFDYSRAGINDRRPLKQWRQWGVTKTNGDSLPDVEVEAALLVPSGADGPKFLVYHNFHVIMRWNRSQYYALSVGHLADRINGAGELFQPPPETEGLTPDQVTQLQTRLDELGFEPGEVDGQLGPATTAAIRRYQKANELVADGFADQELLEYLPASDDDAADADASE